MAEILQIDANTWRLEDGFVRFFLLVGDEKAVLIDSGATCPDAVSLAKTLTDKPILLLNTHGDGDHTSGNGGFREIYMHELDYRLCGLQSRFPETSLVPVNDGDGIDLGNRLLRILFIPGHTKGSIAVLDEKNRVLYAGDTVQKNHIYMFGDRRDPNAFGPSLDKLIAIKDQYDFIYASHGDFCLPNDYAEKVKAAWQAVRNGEVGFDSIDLHGCTVRSYTAEACGFYLD